VAGVKIALTGSTRIAGTRRSVHASARKEAQARGSVWARQVGSVRKWQGASRASSARSKCFTAMSEVWRGVCGSV